MSDWYTDNFSRISDNSVTIEFRCDFPGLSDYICQCKKDELHDYLYGRGVDCSNISENGINIVFVCAISKSDISNDSILSMVKYFIRRKALDICVLPFNNIQENCYSWVNNSVWLASDKCGIVYYSASTELYWYVGDVSKVDKVFQSLNNSTSFSQLRNHSGHNSSDACLGYQSDSMHKMMNISSSEGVNSNVWGIQNEYCASMEEMAASFHSVSPPPAVIYPNVQQGRSGLIGNDTNSVGSSRRWPLPNNNIGSDFAPRSLDNDASSVHSNVQPFSDMKTFGLESAFSGASLSVKRQPFWNSPSISPFGYMAEGPQGERSKSVAFSDSSNQTYSVCSHPFQGSSVTLSSDEMVSEGTSFRTSDTTNKSKNSDTSVSSSESPANGNIPHLRSIVIPNPPPSAADVGFNPLVSTYVCRNTLDTDDMRCPLYLSLLRPIGDTLISIGHNCDYADFILAFYYKEFTSELAKRGIVANGYYLNDHGFYLVVTPGTKDFDMDEVITNIVNARLANLCKTQRVKLPLNDVQFINYLQYVTENSNRMVSVHRLNADSVSFVGYGSDLLKICSEAMTLSAQLFHDSAELDLSQSFDILAANEDLIEPTQTVTSAQLQQIWKQGLVPRQLDSGDDSFECFMSRCRRKQLLEYVRKLLSAGDPTVITHVIHCIGGYYLVFKGKSSPNRDRWKKYKGKVCATEMKIKITKELITIKSENVDLDQLRQSIETNSLLNATLYLHGKNLYVVGEYDAIDKLKPLLLSWAS